MSGSLSPPSGAQTNQIGRASCRERGEISVVAVSLKKKEEKGDLTVTGVQTCALPICFHALSDREPEPAHERVSQSTFRCPDQPPQNLHAIFQRVDGVGAELRRRHPR